MKEIAKAYEPSKIEKELYEGWEKAGYFKPEVNPDGEPFCIIMPPPNANGSLHIGHAVFVTLEDIMTRFARLNGKAALWLPGADHAGFETQVVYEKKLEKEGRNRFEMPREQLYKETLDFTLKNKAFMEGQMRQLGASCDWSREKFTLDEDIVKTVYETFVKLYEDGLVYRDLRLANWCPKHGTSLSDLEVKYEEQEDALYEIKYGPITVATTRPETLFGDVAVAVNPKDSRFEKLIGKSVPLPLTDREIPIIADEMVDPKFGTGAVKITPAHDADDFEVGKRHKLTSIQVIDDRGKIFDNAEAQISTEAQEIIGQKVMIARDSVIAKLKTQGLLLSEKKYTHTVGHCYRCNTIIEHIPKKQWFVAVNKKGEKSGKTLAKDALKAVLDKKVKFITPKFEKIYRHWMTNIRDWNISRQIVWGIQLPVWYRKQSMDDSRQTTAGSNTDIYVGVEPPKDIENWERDPDVFDTWFSSGQWPFATLQGTQKKMGFAGDIVSQVFDNKTKTYRLRDHNLRIGDRLLFEDSSNGRIFGEGVIENIEETTVGGIDLQDKAHWKTYEKRDELINAFKRHYPDKEIAESTPTWIYTYKFHPAMSDQRSAISPDFAKFYPTDVMETGWDILFFWVARMIMLGLYVTGEVPFKNVYLHGLVRDKDRQKMSKSKGNVIDPLGVAEQYGTDAVRMALVFGVAAGNDIVISEEKIRGMRNFANKVWNASRFVLLRVTDGDLQSGMLGNAKIDDLNIDGKILTEADREILKRHEEMKKSVTKNIEKYNFSLAGEEIYEYFWHTFADKYIEQAKNQLAQGVISTEVEKSAEETGDLSALDKSRSRDDSEISNNTKKILIKILSESLIILHPFMPYVTEGVWQELRNVYGGLAASVMIAKWPE